MSESINGYIDRSKKQVRNSYKVTDETLLYMLSDACLLDKLRGVNKDKRDKQKRIYFFERTFEVKQVINQYRKERKRGNIQ